MQDGVKLERKTKDELKQIAQGLGIEKISALKKDEIIALIREKREQIANEEKQKVQPKKRERPADAVEVKGVLDVMTDGFGFLRMENYMSGKNDIYVSPTQIRRFNLKTGDEIVGDCRPSQDEDKFSPLLFVKTINGDPLEIALKRRPFERLTPIYPKEKISLDTGDRTRTASRLIDLIAPIGKGQRGMIVAPPKAGKTTILKQIAQSISENYPDIKLIVLLIDERPEEVTDIKRSIDGEVIYSTFDQMPENHCKVAEMVLERAKSGCADSLWYKDHGEEEIKDVIRRTASGEHVFPDTTPDVEMNWITSEEISPRQLEMLRLYICGMSYSEIAKKMDCSTSGVRWNFQEMITKAGYSCKEDLIAAALESKLIVTTLK